MSLPAAQTGRELSAEPIATIHASAVVIGESAILLRGPSGSGKSRTALALLAEARARGVFARLVADDRVVIRAAGGRLIAAPHPKIAGQIERRYWGIDQVESEAAAVVRLVADLCAEGGALPVRLPDSADQRATIAGVTLPCVRIPPRGPEAIGTIWHILQDSSA